MLPSSVSKSFEVRGPRLAVALLLSVLAVFGCESERERVGQSLAALARELPLVPAEPRGERRQRLERSLAPALAQDFELHVAGQVHERELALGLATDLERVFPLGALALGRVEVEVSPSGKRANARGSARVSASQAGDLHGFDVAFEVDLARDRERWQVKRLVLSEPERGLPEARP